MTIHTIQTSKWALQMEQEFESVRYFPELEMMGGGNFVFFFYDLPNGRRLGINDECIFLYNEDPDCGGIWFHYFEDGQTSMGKVLLSCSIFDLLRNSSPLYL